MELKDLKTRLTKGFVQYKYAVLILIVGLVLMLGLVVVVTFNDILRLF